MAAITPKTTDTAPPSATKTTAAKSLASEKPVTNSSEFVHKRLVKKKVEGTPLTQTLWIAGHATTIAMGLIYTVYYLLFRSHVSKISFIAYRLALIGVFLSYSCTILSQFAQKALPSYITLLGTVNFQYLLLAVVWFFNRSSLFKLVPYLIVSVMQLATQFKIDAVLKLSPQLKIAAAYDELLVFVVLTVDTLLMRGTSGYALFLYAAFFWLRIIESENTRYLLYTVAIKLDSTMAKQKNPKVVSSWKSLKRFLTMKNERFQKEFLN
ncbi:hypothetical protein HII12_000513 [Brettanomyces bruxellensis]|uniref:DEBR0S1_31318g1_1 n=1 Tax=Dekkera bruxellensis TaxID=5007 RepID=A0A7D9CVV8_DEKBR|nr:hypothetical protein HII12_000513 [Brettanomyces bruxellensis]VUG17017.1 DEBR0S1_31318g1_1 [Brettanomyces bruxellensis]